MKLIATVDENWGVGYKNKPLFDIRANRERYLYHIGQNPVIMGRKTFEKIGLLSGKLNIILSREGVNYNPTPEDINNNTEYMCCSSIYDIFIFLNSIGKQNQAIVIGGAKTFETFIDYCDGIYITKVEKECKDVDAYFPVKLDRDDKYSLVYASLSYFSDGLFYINQEYINTKVNTIRNPLLGG